MRVAAAIAIATITSCTIYGESATTDGPPSPSSSDAGDAGDAGNIDWGSSSSGGVSLEGGSDGAVDGGSVPPQGSVPPNGDFEIPMCDGWTGGGSATLGDETIAVHGGSHACKVCGAGTIWSLSRTGTYPAQAGQVLRSVAWVRADTDTVPIEIGITIGSNYQHTDIMTIGTTYTEVTSPTIPIDTTGDVSVVLTVSSGGIACFIVDDAAVFNVAR